MNKETSSRVSTLAAHYMRQNERELEILIETNQASVIKDIRTLAASCMSQDETSGNQIPKSDIHPAPAEFSQAQIAADPILHFFHYAHLPERLQATSRPFFSLAVHVVNTLPRNAERSVALRKLLEAKDAAVRANLPTPGISDFKTTRVASEKEIGIDEAVEVGGHDIDRDGPIPFNG